MTPAQLAFEGGYGRFWILAGLRFEANVCIAGFAVQGSRHFPVVMSGDQHIEEGNGFVFLFLSGELDPRVYRVKALVKVYGWVSGGLVVSAQASAAWGIKDSGKTIIYVREDNPRDGNPSRLGYLNRRFNCMVHPYHTHGHHQGLANWPRVLCGVVSVVVNEVAGAEADVGEVDDVV